MDETLSLEQQHALTNPCPRCDWPLEQVGDLADEEHDIVSCTACDFAMTFGGDTD